MNVVGKVGSLISQGVYSVATPFHPFGGAVDVIVVEQQDGTYRSTPWYVRFGKFQGVLKGAEKIVRISVNGVEANFHMYLDNSGEAYFIREVVSSKDNEVVESSDSFEGTQDDNNNIKNHNLDDKSDVLKTDECVSLGKPQIENVELDDDDSFRKSDYDGYSYESLDQLENVVESQGSDSEVVFISVDGHVLTAPISSSEENMDNVQLSTPQFHLGPGEGAEFGGNDEFRSSRDTWDSNYIADNDASEGPNNTSCEAVARMNGDATASGRLVEVCEVKRQVVSRVQEAGDTENNQSIINDLVDCNSSGDGISLRRIEIFKSSVEFLELDEHARDEEIQERASPCMELEVKGNIDALIENTHPDAAPELKENQNVLDVGNSAGLGQTLSGFPCNSELPLRVENLSPENKALTIDNSEGIVSDNISEYSTSNEQEMKDEQFSSSPQASGEQNNVQDLEHDREPCSSNPEKKRSEFELSLGGHLLLAGMGLGSASEAFDAHRVSEEEFKASASSITKNQNLVVRFKGRYFTWEKAAPLVLGMVAFGLDLPIEPSDAIPVEKDETLKSVEDSPRLTTTPSGRRWRLWPNPFRRVKTLQHTTSIASSEEVFVDSESDSLNPLVEPILKSGSGNESPHKQLVRTNVPTTEQIASLDLKDGQNVITFSFSTRVLGTQQVDAHIYLWKWNARIVISDVDGTITKSDVLGQFMPLVGKDWTQSGVAHLFSAIKENGYQLLFLSARAIVQAYLTRSFLLNLKQDGKALPNGPVVISPDGLFPSLFREVIRRAPHEFKIACLEDIKALFPSDYNPFYAGFGNRDTDELSYRKIGIPKGKIFIINPKGEVAISQHRIDVKSYTSLHTLVNDMFPPSSLVEQEDFNSWNYWKVPLPNIDL